MRFVGLFAILLLAVTVAAPIPVDYTLVGTDVTLDVDKSLRVDTGLRPSLADCAADCARDPNCQALHYSQQHCVLLYVRPCQWSAGLQSAPGVTLLEKSVAVEIPQNYVVLPAVSCGQYVNGNMIHSYHGETPATQDASMSYAVMQFTNDCQAHCSKTTFCQSYTVNVQYDVVTPVNATLTCSVYSDSIYSGVGSAVSVTQCPGGQQLTYGVVGTALSQLNCGKSSPAPLPSSSGPPTGYVQVARNEYMDTDPEVTYYGVQSPASCAAYCSQDPACVTFVHSRPRSQCRLYTLRHCMVAYSSVSGPWIAYGDVYEKDQVVAIPSDEIVQQTQCGMYSGVQIGNHDISNSSDFNGDCHQLCASTSAPFACQSWQVQSLPAMGGVNVNCTLYADSLFRTTPLGGYYSTRRGLCSMNDPSLKSVYGIVGAAKSIPNCGRTPRPMSTMVGGSGAGQPGFIPPPVAAQPSPQQQQQQMGKAAGPSPATPAPTAQDQDSSQAALSVVFALLSAVLALLVF